MKKDFQSDFLIKPIMIIIFGAMCLVFSYATISPLDILVEKSGHYRKAEPQLELEIFSLQWISLICGLVLIIIGIIGLIKLIKKYR
jgi:hypothetical protein